MNIPFIIRGTMGSVSRTTLVVLLIAVIAIAAVGTILLIAPSGLDLYSAEEVESEAQVGPSNPTATGQVTVFVIPG
jgi:hypothetical protein